MQKHTKCPLRLCRNVPAWTELYKLFGSFAGEKKAHHILDRQTNNSIYDNSPAEMHIIIRNQSFNECIFSLGLGYVCVLDS